MRDLSIRLLMHITVSTAETPLTACVHNRCLVTVNVQQAGISGKGSNFSGRRSVKHASVLYIL